MSIKQSLLAALALTLTPSIGCKEKSNTTEQNQSNTSGPAAPGAPATVETNPHQPNPTHAATGQPMGSAAMAPGAADNPMVEGGTGGAGAAGTASGAGGATGDAGVSDAGAAKK